MKQKTSLLSLLLVFALCLGLLAGCGTSVSSEGSAATEASVSEVVTAKASESIPADSTEPVEQSEDGIASMSTDGITQGEITFPLEDPVTLSFWFAPESDGQEMMETYNDNLVMKTAAQQTNVQLELQEISFMSQDEQFNLMVASNDYPDIIQGFGNNYTKGIDNAIDEEIILDLTEMLPKYAPNYNYLRENNAELKKSTTTDTGRVGSFYFLIGDAELGPRQGLWIRQDWLDTLQMDVPTTYDEMYETLMAMKSEFNPSSALLMTQYGYFSDATLLGGYNVGTSFYNENGTIKYGPVEDGFREYMEMIHKWYADGLISSDFSTLTEMTLMFDPSYIINDKCGVWDANYRGDDSWKNNAIDPNFTPLAIADMTKTGTEQIHVGGRGSNVNRSGCVVSTGCEEPEIAVAWIDWWYSDEATLLSSYGIEGETFNFNDEGQPLYTDMILDNPNGSARAMRNVYTGMSLCFRVLRVVTSSYDNGYDILDRGTWDSNRDNAWDISSYIARTADEGETYSSIMSNIETYVQENLPKFLNGDRDLSEWDTYVQDIYDMGLDEVLEIEAACVERYDAR